MSEEKLAQLEAKLEAMEKRLQRREDELDVRKLQFLYGYLALTMMALGVFFGLAGAPAQNAAIQRIVPNEKRGQVSALYLFMFTFFGAMGSFVIGWVSTYIVVDESQVWKAILITAVIFLPTATWFMYRGIRPYREEVERLEKLGL